MRGKLRIRVTTPIAGEMAFNLLTAKMLKEVNKALNNKKTKLDDDIEDAIRAGKIMLDIDVDNQELVFNMEGTEQEIDRWTKTTFRERIISRSLNKIIEIKSEKENE